jgi:hypothetical protein
MREETATVQYGPRCFGERADEHVVVQMRLAVSIHPVRETDDSAPAAGSITVLTPASVSHHERVLLEVVDRRPHRRSMRGHDARSVFRVNRQEYRGRSGCGDHDVIAQDR